MIKGLYIHIPFCEQICSYCDFSKEVAKSKKINEYMNVLTKELTYYKPKYLNLETIYIGGGTPTSIDINLLDNFLMNLNEFINMENIKEFTIEANPTNITDELIKVLLKNNVSRISIGVQTINSELLKLLNRNHQIEDVIKAINILRKHNFNNINLDFIYGIPNQTEEMVLNDLAFIEKYKPNHISYYSLILEEKTVLDYQISKGMIQPLNDDLIADYSSLVKSKLKELNYHHYEISNYSIKDYESLHNLLYWDLSEYIGIGLNASSQYENKRIINQRSITKYLENPYITKEEAFNPRFEFILMGLRKTKGINIIEYKQRFNIDIFEIYPVLKEHINNNLLELNGEYLSFTEQGMDVSNQVYIDLI